MLTEAELKELEELLEVKRINDTRKSLNVIDESKNPNFTFLYNSYLGQEHDENDQLISGFQGVVMEGSSRSGKTWSAVDFIIWLCLHIETNCRINIYRSTFAEFRDTLYDDFKRRLDDYDLPNPFHSAQTVKSFKIGDNVISFKGCDKLGKQHGAGADYIYFNEFLGIPKDVFDQAEMRCRKFWFADLNPSLTQHYLYNNILTREDVGYLRTTFLDNPHISAAEKNKILGYEPWETGSYEVKEDGVYYLGEEITEDNQPPKNEFNHRNGTADEFMWKVYGLGLRGAMEGVIFPNVTWIDEFPSYIEPIYASDFGFTVDPHVTVKYGEDKNNIWIEPLSYYPIETPEGVNDLWEEHNIPRQGVPLPCDSSDRYVSEHRGAIEMVLNLQELGWGDCYKISKTKSVMYWLLSMKKKKIHIIKNKYYKHAKAEQENYKMKEIQGILINQPEDKFNHMFDGARYGHIAFNSETALETEWN